LTEAISGHYRSLASCFAGRARRIVTRERWHFPALTGTESPMAFILSSEQTAELNQIVARYPVKQAACIPALHLCQKANGNWISDDVIQFVANQLDLSAAHVSGVVSFYSLLNDKPTGAHQLWVCRTLSCALRGSEAILKHCENRLGIRSGETTSDGIVTLRTAECLASCGTAPVLQLDEQYHENLSVERLDELLEGLLNEMKVRP
jgi:NADH-quinone oxidoreductase subunit E